MATLSGAHRSAALLGAIGAGAWILVGPTSGCGGGSETALTRRGDGAGASGKGGTGPSGGTGATSAKGGTGGTTSAGGTNGGAGGDETSAGAGGEEGLAGQYPYEMVSQTCGDGVCEHDQAEECDSCMMDCGACPVCGDGTCVKGELESCELCPEDCGACSACGDGKCEALSGESCESCAADCGACPGCGDGTCNEAETCATCPGDCGACKTCGDGVCGAGETCGNCEDDCDPCEKCGDGDCEGNETTANCAKDCGPPERPGCVDGTFEPFWGGAHAHTHLSPDAEQKAGGPVAAFVSASKKANPPLDFLLLTDHHNALSANEYAVCRAASNKFNDPGKFVAHCGWEKGLFEGKKLFSGWTGHFNVLFPDKYYKQSFNLPQFYGDLRDCPTCLGQFNHPPDPGNMHGYKYEAIAKDQVRLVEFNGGASFGVHLDKYFLILDKGWKVSPSWNEDNHHGNWGDTTRATLVYANKLTRGGIRKAIKANRTAATNDDTAQIRLLADDKCWMGSVLKGLGKTKLTVRLADKQKNDGFGEVSLRGSKGKIEGQKDCKGENPCVVTFDVTVDKPGYFVAIARQKDTDVLVSAPIWFEK